MPRPSHPTAPQQHADRVPVSGLVWHEDLEPARLQELRLAAREGRPLPPIEVVRLERGHLIIDGAHRATALGEHFDAIPARVHDLPDTVEVPGWRHAIPRAAAERLRSEWAIAPEHDAAVALLRLDGGTTPLGGPGGGLEHHAVMHRIAELAYAGQHHRLGDGEESPAGWAELEWAPLQLHVIVATARTVGAYPAGVTRFRPLLEGTAS